jgi:hypothetical protein
MRNSSKILTVITVHRGEARWAATQLPAVKWSTPVDPGLNFIGDEGQERVRAAFGEENYNRLARVKQEFDPENTFHGNQNIRPAAS